MPLTLKPIRLDRFFSAAPDPSCGAMASFVGMVRNHDEGRPVKRLYYECYPSMAERMISKLMEEVKQKWNIHEVQVVHRVGLLKIGEPAVAIAVSAAHREEAFQGCRFLIERIKTDVPIWKKQIYADGDGEWVSCHAHPVQEMAR